MTFKIRFRLYIAYRPKGVCLRKYVIFRYIPRYFNCCFIDIKI